MTRTAAYLEFDAICKRFPGVQALDEVSFGVAEGTVHGLVGENGAGKSTLLNVLSGAITPDRGALRLQGRQHVFRSTAEALATGIAVIHQELQLVPEMTVAENLYLGHLPARRGIVDRRALHAATVRQLAAIKEDLDPAAKVGRLPIAQRQMVEIAKALTRGAKVLAFDEPTSSLAHREVNNLFAIIRELKRQGRVILYVSHRLDEIFTLCDAVTVLRDGRRVETFDALDAVTHDHLVNRMVGRDIANVYGYTPRPHGATALEVRDLEGPGLAAPVSFSVAQGEILGLFGLVGAGRSALLRLVYGATRKHAGAVSLQGRPTTIRSPGDAIRHGVMFCPEDRKRDGIIPACSVLENLNLSARRHHARFGLLLDRAWELRNAAVQVQRLDIKTPSLDQRAANLSGGNQQKVVLARWLAEKVKVMLLDEPTRGIDVRAKAEIYAIVHQLARDGIPVILASADLPEVLGVADRILVMRQGRIAADLPRDDATEETVLKLALPRGVGEGLPA